MNRLEGRAAIVTGAARGIGFAIAERLVADGARVLLADISETVAAAADRLGQPHLRMDVSRKAEIEALFEAADSAFGRLDILVNNAGIILSSALLDVTEDDFDRVMAVNVKSAFFATQAAARRMMAHRSGAIINIASVAAILGGPMQISYSVSKAAVKQLTSGAALALAPYGVRVNAIGPGTIDTEMAATVTGAKGEALAQVLSRTPLGRLGKTSEIAAIAAFLASDDASYITGQTIYAEGGRLGLNYFVGPPTAV